MTDLGSLAFAGELVEHRPQAPTARAITPGRPSFYRAGVADAGLGRLGSERYDAEHDRDELGAIQ